MRGSAIVPRMQLLLVEDDPTMQTTLTRALERRGIRVTALGEGHGALARWSSHPPDAVVLDLTLPGLDGVEVCRRIRGFSDAYVLMVTARDDEVDRVVGLEVGADDYLTKPFSPRELVARVRGEPRVVDRRDPIVARQILGNGLRVRTVTLHADAERLDAARGEVGVERPRDCSCGELQELRLVGEIGVSEGERVLLGELGDALGVTVDQTFKA